MHRPRSYRDGARAPFALALAPLLLLVAAGCARQTTSPLATSARVLATEGAGTAQLDAAGGNRAARSYVGRYVLGACAGLWSAAER